VNRIRNTHNNPFNIISVVLLLLILASLIIFSITVNAQNVKICHLYEDNQKETTTMTIEKSELNSHLEHGDYLGVCRGFKEKGFDLRISPNPYYEKTNIQYSLSEPTLIIMEIYDQIGKKVVTLVDEDQDAGNYVYEFSGRGYCYSPGLHILKITKVSENSKSIQFKRLMELH